MKRPRTTLPINSAFSGLLLALFSAAGFSSEGVLGKLVLASGAAPPTVVGVRFALAALGAWAYLGIRHLWHGRTRGIGFRSGFDRDSIQSSSSSSSPAGLPPWPFWALTVVGGVGFAATTVLLFLSFEYLPSGLTLTLLYTYPIIVALGSAIVGDEPLTSRGLGAAILGFLGVAAVGGSSVNVEEGYLLGITFALAAALINAVQLIWTNRLVRVHEPLHVTAQYLSFGTLFVSIVVVISVATGAVAGPHAGASITATLAEQFARVWARPVYIIALSLLPTLLAGVALMGAVKLIGAARTSLIATSEPPLAVVWGAFFLSEPFTVLQLVGTALIVGAILVLFLPEHRLDRHSVR